MNIILCGFQGCGKTTIGQAFSDHYSYDFIDTDQLICESNNTSSVREIHKTLGESAFRELEKKMIFSIKSIKKILIATGGGAVLDNENVNHLKQLGKIIYVHVEPDVIYSRIMKQDSLPSFINESDVENSFNHYINSRKHVYASISDHMMDVTDKAVDKAVLLLNEYRCNHGK